MDQNVRSCCTPKRNTHAATSRPTTHLDTGAVRGDNHTMIYLSGGRFLKGTDSHEGFPADGEGPVKEIVVNPFYIDADTVTNKEFAAFVESTGYKTEAEKYGWSFVFYSFVTDEAGSDVFYAVRDTPWWWAVKNANWMQPEGSGSTIMNRMDHPVVHVSWNDAIVFCQWKGKRLPTEAEWEFAARGGLEQKRYPWGDELNPEGEYVCNIWQGTFPQQNEKLDGYISTAPAQSFPPNDYGLYNVAGNVWEWCFGWFTAKDDHLTEQIYNTKSPMESETKVIKGGSYLCHESYCNRYRVAARSSNTPDSSTGNMGFRCVMDIQK